MVARAFKGTVSSSMTRPADAHHDDAVRQIARSRKS